MAKTVAAIYTRKSNDQGDRSEDVKSVQVQREAAEQFITRQGWTVGPVFSDDGISGAVFAQRPGLQKLLAALQPTPNFQRLVVVEQSRLGRETLDTLMVLRTIERAGVEVWSTRDGRRISLKSDASEILALVESWRDASERRKTAPRVRAAAMTRFDRGYVVGGKTYGYKNVRAGEKQPARRVVNEVEAAVVRRIFEMTRDGFGLSKIRSKLNAEGVPGPKGPWSPTGVREILHRPDYRGEIITNRIQNGRDDGGNDIRIPQPKSEWKRRQDESLRIVSDDLWTAAHARVERTKGAYLRRGNQLVGQVESTKGLYTLSGFLVCGICRKPLIATRRGRNQSLVFVCRERRERQTCSNTTGTPMAELTLAVIKSMNETFTEETFRAHLEQQANDTVARDARAAERAALIANLPKLADAERRLVKRIGQVDDDALVAALKAEWAEAKVARESAEHRIAELEGIERDLAVDRAEVEVLVAKWGEWSQILDEAIKAPAGSAPAVANDVARQVLKKVLVGPIVVTPAEATPVDTSVGRVIAENLDEKLPEAGWTFFGYTRFEGIIGGGLRHGHATSIDFRGHDGRPLSHHLVSIEDIDRMTGRPISGGSDAGVLDRRDTDVAPHTPQRSGPPGVAVAPLDASQRS